MTAQEHFAAGRLSAAIDAQLQEVKAAPLDAGRRTFLFELLAFAGELDRADQQLAVLAQETAEKGWAARSIKTCSSPRRRGEKSSRARRGRKYS